MAGKADNPRTDDGKAGREFPADYMLGFEAVALLVRNHEMIEGQAWAVLLEKHEQSKIELRHSRFPPFPQRTDLKYLRVILYENEREHVIRVHQGDFYREFPLACPERPATPKAARDYSISERLRPFAEKGCQLIKDEKAKSANAAAVELADEALKSGAFRSGTKVQSAVTSLARAIARLRGI